MRTALIAALAALGASAWAAPSYAQGDHWRGGGEHHNGGGGQNGGGRRGDNGGQQGGHTWNGGGGQNRGGGAQQQQQQPVQPAPQQAWRASPGVQQGWRNNHGQSGPRQAWGGGGQPQQAFQGGRGPRQAWSGQGQNGSQQAWNRGGDRSDHRGPQSGWSGGRNDHAYNGYPGRGGQVNRGRDNRNDWSDRGRDSRGRDWGRDNGRRYAWNDHGWYDGRRGYDRRWSDWRRIPYGGFFNRGYAYALGRYWGGDYFWWSYTGWDRPYRGWRVGYILPWDAYWEPIPADLYYYLPPPPYGCDYVLVGRDILLISLASHMIIDALMLSDAYDNGYGGGYYDDY